MATPGSLKSALESGYVINGLYARHNKRIRVELKEGYHEADRKMFLSFWIDRKYFEKTYPSVY